MRRSPTRFRCAFFGPSQLHARRSGRCAGGGVAPIALASGAKLRACQVRTAAAQIAPGGAKCDFSPSDAESHLRGCGAAEKLPRVQQKGAEDSSSTHAAAACWRRWRACDRPAMYILSIQTHTRYSRDLHTHARRPLRLSTSSQSSENTPKTACRHLLRQAARAQAQERERADACAHTQARPTHSGPRAPHRRQVLLERRRQQPPVVEAELHLLHVDDLLQPPVAARRVALAAGWRADGDVVGRSPGHLAFLPAGDDGTA